MEKIISPKLDSLLKIFLSINKLDYLINIEEQKLQNYKALTKNKLVE